MRKKPPSLKELRKKKPACVEINLNGIQDIDDMISDLRNAKAKAKRNGGEYVVGRMNFDGEKIVFNIRISHEECS